MDHPQRCWIVLLAAASLCAMSTFVCGLEQPATASRTVTEDRPVLDQLSRIESFAAEYCAECHVGNEPDGGFNLEELDFSPASFTDSKLNMERWERILRRIDTRQMPPPTASRPSDAEYKTTSQSLGQVLADYADRFPQPGRVAAMRRLTRTEYQNAIRDLLAINIDAKNYLPQDESSHGFDNITVEELSPTHLNRYLSAAQKIARAAIGRLGNGPAGVTIRLPADRTQEEHVAGLPFGTRGGITFEQHFAQSGEYEIEMKLTRDRDEKVEGLLGKHNLDVLVDRKRVHRFLVEPPAYKEGEKWEERDFTHSDSHLKTRIQVTAGSHQIGVTFPKTASSLTDSKRQPFDATFNRHRHPRRTPAIYQVSIVGPFASQGPGETKSRQLIFGDEQDGISKNPTAILRRMARRAYRRPATEDELQLLMTFYDRGREEADDDFEAGIEAALAALLVNPNFLFRIESAQGKELSHSRTSEVGGGSRLIPVGDYELATRLSYFLWSSNPDDELLQLAERGRLQHDAVLRRQVLRMLADDKSISLVNNFASQWLYLRNLESVTPDLRLFPDFDDNLRLSFQRETELLFQDVLRNDRSVLDLIRSDHTFLNQRLAKHYGIPGVTGSRFRKVSVDGPSRRGGILRHGSILMVTSYATRTSPTIRGNWVLENVFGTPVPPPPPDIPNLKENTAIDATSVRERLAAHRANPMCASCHDLIDPVGFALENYDAVGRWREFEGTIDIDSAGRLPDGTQLSSVAELEQGILRRPQIFARTLTEKLITFALGRSIEPFDGPTVRQIVAASEQDNFTLSSIITGIVLSKPFRMRSIESP